MKKGYRIGGSRRELAVEPVEVIGSSVDHREGNDFGGRVRVEASDFGTQAIEQEARGLDEKHGFGGLLDCALPMVEALDGREKLDTGGEAQIEQVAGDLAGLIGRRAGGEDYDLICHEWFD
jgi:hypothetical protein